jgi:hypothetical protein
MIMKVALLENYGMSRAGQIIDLPAGEAQRLINSGCATLAEEPAKEPPKIKKPTKKKS